MHRTLQRGIPAGVAVVGLLVVACGAATQMLRIHENDMRVYSVTPEGKVQVIGLRDRTYLLDYGGDCRMILFRTTFSTGVATYARKDDIYRADRDHNHQAEPDGNRQ